VAEPKCNADEQILSDPGVALIKHRQAIPAGRRSKRPASAFVLDPAQFARSVSFLIWSLWARFEEFEAYPIGDHRSVGSYARRLFGAVQ